MIHKVLTVRFVVFAADLACPVISVRPGRILQPCGLIANSYFNDVITLTNNGIAMDETGIAWESDKEKFKNPPWTPEKMLVRPV